MVRGCGSALLNQELRSALWSLLAIPLRAFHIRRVGRFMEDLRVMALQKHRGGLTAPFGRGGAQLTDIWLWFVYVCCQWSPPPGKSQGLQMCACLCEVYKLK